MPSYVYLRGWLDRLLLFVDTLVPAPAGYPARHRGSGRARRGPRTAYSHRPHRALLQSVRAWREHRIDAHVHELLGDLHRTASHAGIVYDRGAAAYARLSTAYRDRRTSRRERLRSRPSVAAALNQPNGVSPWATPEYDDMWT